MDHLTGAAIDLDDVPPKQPAKLFDVGSHDAPRERALTEDVSRGIPGTHCAGEASRGEPIDRRDRRSRRHHVAQIRHEHRRPESDPLRRFRGAGEMDPDILVERGGVVHPDAVVAELLGKHGEVGRLTRSCDGCMYGSYPEITVTARFLKPLLRRFLFFNTETHQMLKKHSEEEIREIARDVHARHERRRQEHIQTGS